MSCEQLLIYIAETIEPRFRGMLTASGTATVLGGVFLQFIIGSMLHWRTVAAISSIIPFLAFNAVFLVPESPYWLYTKNRIDDAHKSLQWLRGWVTFDVIADEFQTITHSVENLKTEKKIHSVQKQNFSRKLKLFSKRSFVAPFLLILVGFVFGHFSGMTPLQTYSIQILSAYNVPINEYYATIFLGAAQVIGCLLGMMLVRSSGKRRLVFMSFIGCGVCFFAVATQSHYLYGSHQRDFDSNTNNMDTSIDNLEQNVFDVILALRNRANNELMNKNQSHPSVFENEYDMTGSDAEILDKILKLHDEVTWNITQTDLKKLNEFSNKTGLFGESHAINGNDSTQVDNWIAQSGMDVEKLSELLNISKYIIRPFMVNEGTTILQQVNKIEQDIWDILTVNSTETTSHLPAIINELSTTLSTFAESILHEEIEYGNEIETNDDDEDDADPETIGRWMPLIILLSGSMFAHCGAKLFPWMLIGEV